MGPCCPIELNISCTASPSTQSRISLSGRWFEKSRWIPPQEYHSCSPDLAFDVKSVKQMTEGSVTTVSFPRLLVRLLHCHKSHTAFAVTSHSNVFIKVEIYRVQIRVTHLGLLNADSGMSVVGGHRHRVCLEKSNGASKSKCVTCEARHPCSYEGCSCTSQKVRHGGSSFHTRQVDKSLHPNWLLEPTAMNDQVVNSLKPAPEKNF
jgi:hypothetical protein